MALKTLFSAGKVPTELVGRTVVIADAATLGMAEDFLLGLETAHGPLALAVVGETDYTGPRPSVKLPSEFGADQKRLKRLRPVRTIAIGDLQGRHDLPAAAGAPVFWINARAAGVADANCKIVTVASDVSTQKIPGAEVTGDPLIGIETLPRPASDPSLCERFKEYRERDFWVFAAAGTGEEEEALAYAVLFELLRRQTAIMILAPREAERMERVYHDSLKYNLPTIRHSRLYTSYVPKKNRIYYVEDTEVTDPIQACADVVILGGSLHQASTAEPDIVTPILLGRPVVVGPHRRHPAVAAAIEAGVVLTADEVEGLAEQVRGLLESPESRETLAEKAGRWLEQQAGARQKVLALID